MNARVLFFVGKGGVGKSTNSSLFALKLARAGKRVLLNSIDPAHNLHDIFQFPFDSKPRRIVPGLEAMETDLDRWVKKYLKDTERDFRSVYKYQEAFNLHRYFKTLKYSPGLEEYAVLLALVNTLRRFADRDYIVFDTPPTALTLKFLALPDVSLLWLKELSQFRQLILDKEQIITRIRQGRKQGNRERDPILGKIADLVDVYRGMSDLVKDPAITRTFLVLNEDELSLAESRLIWKEMTNLGMTISYLIVNKANRGGRFAERIKREFPHGRLLFLPAMTEGELTGLHTLDSVELPLDIAEL
ncbi:MAG: ArsA family ATPase [Spirochaetaceae bacterium]|nr:MAG: ArsA family ATPase [Spirochaetaceae bacterium]